MMRIISVRSFALAAALFAVGCTQSAETGDTVQQDGELRGAHLVNVSGSATESGNGDDGFGGVPVPTAHPTTRLGPSPDPWNGDGNGPSPDPWQGRGGGSGEGKPAPAPAPGDPSNPNQ